MKYACIFWDWNGTVVDDCAQGFAAFNAVLREHGIPPTTLDVYRQHITTPVRNFYAMFFNLNETSFAELDRAFTEHYAERAQTLSLAQGIVPLLERFRADGVRQVLLTSSWQHVVEQFARTLGVAEYFDAVLGGTALTDGSKIDRARIYLERNGLRPQDCAVVGDTVHDWEVARALGMDCVLVTTGHQARAVLEQCEVPLADSCADVARLLGA